MGGKYGILECRSHITQNSCHRTRSTLLTWGAINLMEGYGGDNPGAKAQGIKQMAAGGGVILIGTTLVPMLSGLLG